MYPLDTWQLTNRRVEAFLHTLTPSESGSNAWSAIRKEICARLRRALPLRSVIAAGSRRRRTAIAGQADYDMIAVFGTNQGEAIAPSQLFEAIARTLRTLGNVEIASPACVLTVPTGHTVDIVPAIQAGPDFRKEGWIRLPGAPAQEWVMANPRHQDDLVVRAARKQGRLFRSVVKGVKLANNANRKPLRSFHIELLLAERVPWTAETVLEALAEATLLAAHAMDQPTKLRGELIDEYLAPASRLRARQLLSDIHHRCVEVICHCASSANAASALTPLFPVLPGLKDFTGA